MSPIKLRETKFIISGAWSLLMSSHCDQGTATVFNDPIKMCQKKKKKQEKKRKEKK